MSKVIYLLKILYIILEQDLFTVHIFLRAKQLQKLDYLGVFWDQQAPNITDWVKS